MLIFLWNIIGFFVLSSQNFDGKMVEWSGIFDRMSSDGGFFYKYGIFLKVISGGLWIFVGFD